jgi:hypothetical protein
MMDEYVREPMDKESVLTKWIDGLKTIYPWTSEQVEPKRTDTGELVKQPFNTRLLSAVLPGNVKEINPELEQKSDIPKELRKISQYNNELVNTIMNGGTIPSNMDIRNTVKGFGFKYVKDADYIRGFIDKRKDLERLSGEIKIKDVLYKAGKIPYGKYMADRELLKQQIQTYLKATEGSITLPKIENKMNKMETKYDVETPNIFSKAPIDKRTMKLNILKQRLGSQA